MKYLVWKKGLGRGGEGKSFIFFCYFVLSPSPRNAIHQTGKTPHSGHRSHWALVLKLDWLCTVLHKFLVRSTSQSLQSQQTHKFSKWITLNWLSQSRFYESSGRHFQGQLMWFRLHYLGWVSGTIVCDKLPEWILGGSRQLRPVPF